MAKCQPPGPPAPPLERVVEAAGHAEARAGVARRRAGVEVEAAVGDLGDHVRGRVEHVLVGRGAAGAGLGVHAGRIARRGRGVTRRRACGSGGGAYLTC